MEGLLDTVLTSFISRVPAYSIGFLFGIFITKGKKEERPGLYTKV